MSNYYGLVFSNTDPSQYPSLAPTFLTFRNALTGQTLSPPSLTQVDVTGVYGFTYAVTSPIYFRVDGITTAASTDRYVQGILDPADNIDNQVAVGVTVIVGQNSTLTAIGTTNVALGTTNIALGTTSVALGISNAAINATILAHSFTGVAISSTIAADLSTLTAISTTMTTKIGTAASLFGDSSTDPADLFGFLKRMQEYGEGTQTFNKTNGTWTIKDRAGLTTIATKTLDNTSTQVTRD